MAPRSYHGPQETELAPDPEQIAELFEFWFHRAIRGIIEIGWINPKTGAITNFERFELGDETIVERIVEVNKIPGQSVYFRPALINHGVAPVHYTTDDDFLAAPGVWADLDDKDAVLGAPKIYSSCRPTAYVITGTSPHTRAQPFWRADEMIHGAEMVRRLNSNIQHKLNGDRAVVNPTTLMRVGGTIAWPYKEGRVVEMTRFKNKFPDNRPSEVPLHALHHWFPAPPTALERLKADMVTAATTAPTPLAIAPQQPKTAGAALATPAAMVSGDPEHFAVSGQLKLSVALNNINAGRQWHNNVLAVVAHWIGKGWTDREILAAAESFTLPPYQVRDTLRDVDKMIRSARTKFAKPEPAEQPITLPSASERAWELIWMRAIEANVSALDFVENFLRDGEMSVVYGESGCGKTFLVLDIAFHVATGMPWRGHAVDQGGVIYCALEGSHGIKNRIAALKDHYKMHDRDIPLAVLPVSVNLLDPAADTDKLIALIKEAAETCGHPIKLVVVDTLSRALFGGNENSPDDMGALVINADRIRQVTGAHVLFVHHSGKNQALGARGHSLLRAATDTEIEVSRPEGATVSNVTVTKQRELDYAEDFAFSLKPIELGMNRRHKPVTSCVVNIVDAVPVPPPMAKSLTEKEVLCMEKITSIFATPGTTSTEVPLAGMQPQVCIDRDFLREELVRVGFLATDPDTNDVLRSESTRLWTLLNALESKRKIAKTRRWLWLLS